MDHAIFETPQLMGRAAATHGAQLIQQALDANGAAAIIVATGASQFEMLEHLVQADLDWSKVTGFHLDEYLHLPMSHPASFRGYLKTRFVDRVPLKAFHYIDGEQDALKECERLASLIHPFEINVAFVGIGENGHLAFNDPPADFETTAPYLVVDLDEACRQQQLGEGWFPRLDAVPTQAISMSIRQILASQHLICTVPDERKARAVRLSLQGPVTNEVPASVLQTHEQAHLYLDQAAAQELSA